MLYLQIYHGHETVDGSNIVASLRHEKYPCYCPITAFCLGPAMLGVCACDLYNWCTNPSCKNLPSLSKHIAELY